MFALRIGASAERDLLIGFAFYESQAVGLGQYFIDSLIADIDALALYAGMHPKPLSGLHRSLSKRFPLCHLLRLRRQHRDYPCRARLPSQSTFHPQCATARQTS